MEQGMRKTAMNDADKQQAKRTRKRRFLLCAAALLLLICFGRYDGYTLPEWWRDAHSGIVCWQADTVSSEVAGETKQVALTFDDGPDPRCTPRILDILRRYNIKATFFVEGRFLRAYPDSGAAHPGRRPCSWQPYGHASRI